MPTLKRPGLPEVWVSTITSLLAGEAQCQYAPWLKAHFRIEHRADGFDRAAWKVAHQALLDTTRQRYTTEGWTCSVEGQNYLRVTGHTCVLIGKPDLIGRKGRVRVADCKTGKSHSAHLLQVAIYLVMVPLAWHRKGLELDIDGEVVYADHAVPIHSIEAATIRPALFRLLRKLGSAGAPAPTPSAHECQFCDVTAADCPARTVAPMAGAEAITQEF